MANALRYERKFQVDRLSLDFVLSVLRRHPAGFRPLFPDRTIHNIYFDTPELVTHTYNLLGAGERRKFRVRWYGDTATEVVQPRLEIKRRLHLLGDKLSYPVTPWEWSSLRALTHEVRSHVPDAPALLPQLYNRYRRSYLSTTDGRFRITIDRDLAYLPLAVVPAATLAIRLSGRLYPDASIVVELKYAAADDERVGEIMAHLPFRITKKSKYATGMLTVG